MSFTWTVLSDEKVAADMIFGDKDPESPDPSRVPFRGLQVGLPILQSGELGSLLRVVVVGEPVTLTVTIVEFPVNGPLPAKMLRVYVAAVTPR